MRTTMARNSILDISVIPQAGGGYTLTCRYPTESKDVGFHTHIKDLSNLQTKLGNLYQAYLDFKTRDNGT